MNEKGKKKKKKKEWRRKRNGGKEREREREEKRANVAAWGITPSPLTESPEPKPGRMK